MEQEAKNHRVPYTKILEILPHPKADRLEFAVVFGFQVIVKKDAYKVGDEVIYVPIDSILPQWLEDKIFPPDSKIKLNKHRVRQIRIRGLPSQGMLMSVEDVAEHLGIDRVRRLGTYEENEDLSEALGITKYEPPETFVGSAPGGRKIKKDENPLFHKYNGLDNIKWYPQKFKPDEIVVLQEKIHGSNARAALLPYVANTLWRKFKKFLRLTPEYEFCYGSNNVQLQQRDSYRGYYSTDIYGNAFAAVNAQMKIEPGETIYCEIYGDGIQKNYNYGLTNGEHKLILFDVKVLQEDGTQKWLSPDEVRAYGEERGFEVVPEIYRGPFNSLEFVKEFTKGNSVLVPSQKVREGVVVKAVENYDEYGNKRALKVISEEYLDDPTNTDNH